MRVLSAFALSAAQVAAAQDSPVRTDLVLSPADPKGSVTALDVLERIERLRGEWFVVSQDIETILASHSIAGPDPLVIPEEEVMDFLDWILAGAWLSRTRTIDGFFWLYIPGTKEAERLLAASPPFVLEEALGSAAEDPHQLIRTVVHLTDVDRWQEARGLREHAAQRGVQWVCHSNSLVCAGRAQAVAKLVAEVRGDPVPTFPVRSEGWRRSLVLEWGTALERTLPEELAPDESSGMFRMEQGEIVIEPGDRRRILLSDYVLGLETGGDLAFTYTDEVAEQLSRHSQRIRPSRIRVEEITDFLTQVLYAEGFPVTRVGPEPVTIYEITWLGTIRRGRTGGAHLYVEHEELATASRKHGPFTKATMVVELPHLDVRGTVNDLRPIFPSSQALMMLPAGDTNSIVLTGPLGQLRQRTELLSVIHANALRGPELREVDVRGLNPSDIAAAITKLPRGSDDGVGVAPSPDGASLLVAAPAEKTDEVLVWIERLLDGE